MAAIVACGVVGSDLAPSGKAWAQDPPATASTARSAQAEPSAEEEQDREIRRLPPFYAQVIAPYQREKVYEIQKRYDEQVLALQEQIRALLRKRDQEIEAILVPEQREALQKIREQAKERARLTAERRRARAEAGEGEASAEGAANP